jgi:hypothetical protein
MEADMISNTSRPWIVALGLATLMTAATGAAVAQTQFKPGFNLFSPAQDQEIGRQSADARLRSDTNPQSVMGIANGAAEADPRSLPLGLLAHAVNEVIDIKAKRDIAVANHVPESVLLMMMGFAVLALAHH